MTRDASDRAGTNDRTMALAAGCVVVWIAAAASARLLGIWLAIGAAALALGLVV
jgi:hypothetical protein